MSRQAARCGPAFPGPEVAARVSESLAGIGRVRAGTSAVRIR